MWYCFLEHSLLTTIIQMAWGVVNRCNSEPAPKSHVASFQMEKIILKAELNIFVIRRLYSYFIILMNSRFVQVRAIVLQ